MGNLTDTLQGAGRTGLNLAGAATGIGPRYEAMLRSQQERARLTALALQHPAIREILNYRSDIARNYGVKQTPIPPGTVQPGSPPGAIFAPQNLPNVVQTPELADQQETEARADYLDAQRRWMDAVSAGQGSGQAPPGMVLQGRTIGKSGPVDRYGNPTIQEFDPGSSVFGGGGAPQYSTPQAIPYQGQTYQPPAQQPRRLGASGEQTAPRRLGGGAAPQPVQAQPSTQPQIGAPAQPQPQGAPSPAALADPELASAFDTLGITPQAPVAQPLAQPVQPAPAAPLPSQPAAGAAPPATAPPPTQPGTGRAAPQPRLVGGTLAVPKARTLTPDDEMALNRVMAARPDVAAKVQQAGSAGTAVNMFPELSTLIDAEKRSSAGATTDMNRRITANTAQLTNDDKAFLRGVQAVGRIVQDIYTEFPDMNERDQFIGMVNNPLQRAKSTAGAITGNVIGQKNARFERFQALIGQIEKTKFTEGGKQLTGIEQRIVNKFIPTGREGGGVTAFDQKARTYFEGIGPAIGEWAKLRGPGDVVVNTLLSEYGIPPLRQ